MSWLEQNNEREKKQRTVDKNWLWPSINKEVSDPLWKSNKLERFWYKKEIDNIYQELIESAGEKTKKILSEAVNKWIFYSISSKILDKLAKEKSKDQAKDMFQKYATKNFLNILKEDKKQEFFKLDAGFWKKSKIKWKKI